MIKRHKHFIETSIIWNYDQPLNGNERYDPGGRTDTVPWEHQSWGQVPAIEASCISGIRHTIGASVQEK